MTDHDDALPDLDLDVLGDGVSSSPDQWEAITATAGHRRRRRTAVLSVAAALILVAATATVLLSRSDHDGGIDLATGGASEPVYVLPPTGAEVVRSAYGGFPERTLGTVPIGTYSVEYVDEGRSWVLTSSPITDGASASPTTPPTTTGNEPVVPNLQLATDRFGTVDVSCGLWIEGVTPDSEARTVTGPNAAQLVVGDNYVVIMPTIELGGECALTAPGAKALAAQMNRIRLVEFPELQDYLGSQASTSTSKPPELLPTTTTTADPSSVPADAEAQIEAAVKGFNVPAADGTWPFLEDGVARADEYRERQELSWQQSGLTAMGDEADMVQEVVSITFESPTSAQVDFQITVTLQTGRRTWPHHGRFILEDGVWKMSRESNIQISGLACTAPQPDVESCRSGG